MVEPSISVIISIYNVEKYINQCVESVLAQSYMPKEILLVNDGSKDSSLQICEEYQKKYPRIIKTISKQNGGLSSARNTGINNSSGEYCYFLDGDDLIKKDTILNFVSIIREYGDLDFIHGRMSFFYDGGELDDCRVRQFYIDNAWANGSVSGQDAFCNAYRNQSALDMGVRGLYKRNFILKNNLFFVEKTIPWGEDEEWTPRVFLYAKKCCGNDKPDYLYRENRAGSETTKLANIDTIVTMIDVYSGWVKLLENNECTNEFKDLLRKESGKRYLDSVVKNSAILNRNDYKRFIKHVLKEKKLISYVDSQGKSIILFRLFGVNFSSHLIRLLTWNKRKI